MVGIMVPGNDSEIRNGSENEPIEDDEETQVEEQTPEQKVRLERALEASLRVLGYGEKRPPPAKPDCSSLQGAIIVDDSGQPETFLAQVGTKVVLEYTKQLWRPTTRYEIAKIKENGDLLLWDPENSCYAMSNWKTAGQHGINIYLETKKISLAPPRKRKEGKERPPPPPLPLDANGDPIKRKRGRPKGSKNKATIAKELAVKKVTYV